MIDLLDMTREQLIGRIMHLEEKISRMEKIIDDASWVTNPDRMGGQFTREETERNWNGWR